MNKSILALSISSTLAFSTFALAEETVAPPSSRPAMEQAPSGSDTTNRAQANPRTKTPKIIPFSQRSRPPMEAQARSKPRSAAKATEVAPAEVTPADMHPGRLKRTQYQ
ncbi:hypothetical protein [Janthinobacterium sp. B9-8]|uniref:hypothetical protein n=1 Tax=Janthinobacterium sp. B9-8 TaxID=1236179 RepID=UPI00061CEFE9|nr:hypothetical protein [Janthinobacterium sp. B9-8]AMC34520.1 hypothetical protein VN23_07855 [Janthinobacterium sp. B9-8]